MKSIGVVALCKNEEVDLPAFLANCKEWADQVVIVDDGSTDRSKEIALGGGENVLFIEHPMGNGGFAEQRNIGLDTIETDWVLNMDIDERVTPEFAKEMRTAIEQGDKHAFRYRRMNFFLHRRMRGGGWAGWNRPQLGRKGKHRYEGVIHEKCVVEGGDSCIGQLKEMIWHLNDQGYDERMRKSVQYSTAEAEKLLIEGKKVSALGMLWAMVREFLNKYVYRRGYRDGMAGFISALHAVDAVFRANALAWDRQNRIERSDLESSIEQKWKTWKK